MKHSVFLVYRNVPNYSSYLTTKDTDFSKKTQSIGRQIEKMPQYSFLNKPQKNISNSMLKNCWSIKQKLYITQSFFLEAKRKKYIEAFDAYWYQQRVLIPMEVYL